MRWIDMHCDTVSEIIKQKRNADEKYIVRRYGTA